MRAFVLPRLGRKSQVNFHSEPPFQATVGEAGRSRSRPRERTSEFRVVLGAASKMRTEWIRAPAEESTAKHVRLCLANGCQVLQRGCLQQMLDTGLSSILLLEWSRSCATVRHRATVRRCRALLRQG